MQTVTLSTSNLFSSLSTNEKITSQAPNSDFRNYLNKNMSSNIQKKNDAMNEVATDNRRETLSENSKLAKKANDSDAKSEKESTSKVTDKNSESVKDTSDDINAKTTKEPNDKSDDKDSLENVAELENKVKGIVKETLNLTDEELSNAMSVLGLQMLDLLNQNNLKSLALFVNGGDDITSILTNENLANTINNLTAQIQGIDLDQDFSLDMNQINEYLQKNIGINEKNNNQVQISDSNKDMKAEIIQTDISNETSMADNNNKQPLATNKEPIIEVEKSTDSLVDEAKVSNNLAKENVFNSKANSDSASSNNSNANQSDELNYSPVDTLLNNLTNAVSGNVKGFSEQIADIREMRMILNQIVEQVKVTIKPNTTSMEMNLNPESLGKVNLSVASKDGVMTAHLIVQNEVTREAIQSQLQVLKDSLEAQGLKVESVEVTVSNFGFEQSNQADSREEKREPNKRNVKAEDIDGLDTSVADDDSNNVLSDLLGQSGSNVDFTA